MNHDSSHMSARSQAGILNVTTVLRILMSNATDEVRPVLKTAVTEIERLRQIEAAVREAVNSTTKGEKATAWQKLIELVQ